MAKEVAERWLGQRTEAEYRLRILYGGQGIKNIPGLLRAFRDRKATLQDVPAIPKLGVREGFDFVEVWAHDYDGLVQLRDWFEGRGYETSGVW
jgi:hypothetical protein